MDEIEFAKVAIQQRDFWNSVRKSKGEFFGDQAIAGLASIGDIDARTVSAGEWYMYWNNHVFGDDRH